MRQVKTYLPLTTGNNGVSFRMPSTVVVIPCYNEACRLDIDRFLRYLRNDPPARLLFVDDGSTDDTRIMLQALQAVAPEWADILPLETNRGKAEAVRRGMLAALGSGADFVGYWDADLATPLEVIGRFCERLQAAESLQAVFGARVRLLGRDIRRHLSRHLLGRAFAMGASCVLGLGIYDTQCGAKLFRGNQRTRELFHTPFCSKWIFDVELIARMIAVDQQRGPTLRSLYELPLDTWHDVDGSKVKPRDFLAALVDLHRIYRRYLRGVPRLVDRELVDRELEPVRENTPQEQPLSPAATSQPARHPAEV